MQHWIGKPRGSFGLLASYLSQIGDFRLTKRPRGRLIETPKVILDITHVHTNVKRKLDIDGPASHCYSSYIKPSIAALGHEMSQGML